MAQERNNKTVYAKDILAKIEDGEKISYENVTIVGDLDFRDFDRQITNERSFRVRGSIVIKSSQIEGNINFSNTIFQELVSFIGVRFYQNVEFIHSRFDNNLDFIECVFKESVKLSKSIFIGNVNIIRSKFEYNVDFAACSFKGIVNLSDTIFKDIANFNNSHFGNDLYLNGTDYYKLELHWEDVKYRLRYDDTVFRLLINNYKKWGKYEDARNCYHRYRIKHRAELTSYFSIAVDHSEKILSEYGSSPLRIFFILFIIIIVFGMLFSICGAICINSSCSNACNNPPSLSDPFLYSIIVFLGKIPTDLRAVGLFRWLAVLEAILGWLILGLLLDTAKKMIEI